jgi:hypothetical protein
LFCVLKCLHHGMIGELSVRISKPAFTSSHRILPHDLHQVSSHMHASTYKAFFMKALARRARSAWDIQTHKLRRKKQCECCTARPFPDLPSSEQHEGLDFTHC